MIGADLQSKGYMKMSGAETGNTVAVILAGGRNRRMMSKLPKAMHKIGGIPMIGMVYNAVKAAGVGRCVVVVGFGAEYIVDYMGARVEYAYQYEQLGTGHAFMTGMDYLGGYDGRVLSLYGDMPLVSKDTLSALIQQNTETGDQGTLVYAYMQDQRKYGRIVRDKGGNFAKIVEEKDATAEEALIREVNPGIYCFDAAAARIAVRGLNTDNAQGEMYLTDVPAAMLKAGGRIGLHKMEDSRECLGVNDRADLEELNRALYMEKCRDLMIKCGVTIMDSGNTYIDMGVTVGMDTVIYPGCVIEGDTAIGEGCVIGPGARITDSEIGDRASIAYSVVNESKIGREASVGPFAYLRPGADIGDRVKIGDFVEIKNANIGRDAKISHLAYVGDADVGANANIGCGAITCNYDGVKKYRTVIGENAFIGSNANLIAPVTINDGAYIASGSTITDDVPEDALAIARGRQVIKEHWVSRKGFKRG